MELRCSLQNYPWGKLGSASAVASLVSSADGEFAPHQATPYAELWMGTHPNGPSYLKSTNQPLHEYIKENSRVLGREVEDVYGTKLPFLFKVLSVRQALSIQVHPNKEQAEKLYRSQPTIYKDPNHKPEMTIALTTFEAFCGFRPISEIHNYIETVPELRAAIGEADVVAELASGDEATAKNALRRCFASLMRQRAEAIAGELKRLLKRLASLDEAARETLHAEVLERLHRDYPGDVGCFGVYLFNYIVLRPGEAMYLGVNEPHAYLSGDCIECMACSDNVIRAGLTSKLKDVEALVDMLSYDCQPAEAKRFQAVREDECTEIFRPPIQDFALARIIIPADRSSYKLIPRSTASVLIIIEGEARTDGSRVLRRGSVWFVPARESIAIEVLSGDDTLLMFQAFANIS